MKTGFQDTKWENCWLFNVDNLDFTVNPEDLSSIIDKIDAQIHGLF
jgi:hypothetical protein